MVYVAQTKHSPRSPAKPRPLSPRAPGSDRRRDRSGDRRRGPPRPSAPASGTPPRNTRIPARPDNRPATRPAARTPEPRKAPRPVAPVSDNIRRSRTLDAVKRALPQGSLRIPGALGVASALGVVGEVLGVSAIVLPKFFGQMGQGTLQPGGVNPQLGPVVYRKSVNFDLPHFSDRLSETVHGVYSKLSPLDAVEDHFTRSTYTMTNTIWPVTTPLSSINVPPGEWLWRGGQSRWHAEARRVWPNAREVFGYYNPMPMTVPAYVPARWVSPLPLGQPLPAPRHKTSPRIRPRREPRQRLAPRLRPRPEVAVHIQPGRRPNVVPSIGRKPGPNTKESKFKGIRGAASIVFWTWEAANDWTDWVNIIVNNISTAPKEVLNGTPLDQIQWLFENPDEFAHSDLLGMFIDFVGWAIDEKVGATFGEFQKYVSRRIAIGDTTLDMRLSADQWYSWGASPGSWWADAISALR